MPDVLLLRGKIKGLLSKIPALLGYHGLLYVMPKEKLEKVFLDLIEADLLRIRRVECNYLGYLPLLEMTPKGDQKLEELLDVYRKFLDELVDFQLRIHC